MRKRALQAKLKEIYTKLDTAVPEPEAEPKVYKLPGNFNSHTPMAFRDLVESAGCEGADLELLKSAVHEYLQANETLIVGT